MSIYKKNSSHFLIAQRASFAVTPRTPATLSTQWLSQFYKQLSPIYKLQVASSNLTSAPLASNRPHLPPVIDFLNRSIFLHTSHTLFCHEVHNPNSRSQCGLAGKRTQNLRAILLLLGNVLFIHEVKSNVTPEIVNTQ